jgi:hypothetical protein
MYNEIIKSTSNHWPPFKKEMGMKHKNLKENFSKNM